MAFPLLRSRLAALVLLLASPGFAGVAVDAAHPCPEKAPWTVEVRAHEGHTDGGQHHSSLPGDRHECKCVGACQATPALRSVDADQVLALVGPEPVVIRRPLQSALLPVTSPGHRLPPATAPPLI